MDSKQISPASEGLSLIEDDRCSTEKPYGRVEEMAQLPSVSAGVPIEIGLCSLDWSLMHNRESIDPAEQAQHTFDLGLFSENHYSDGVGSPQPANRNVVNHLSSGFLALSLDSFATDSETSSSIPSTHTQSLPPELSENRADKMNEQHSLQQPRSSSDNDDSSNIKTNILSAWNNMKYGFPWNAKTNFKTETPIFLLGTTYYCEKEEKENQRKAHEDGQVYVTNYDKFCSDFSSRLWFTYRKEFPTLPLSSLTSDIGWGCMLRSGQMLIANALVMHVLGRVWRYREHKAPGDALLHAKIIQLFGDYPLPQCPFSIHKLVDIGNQTLGKLPGDWYGPSSVAHVLREAFDEAALCNSILQDLAVYLAQDCTIYVQDLKDICRQEPAVQIPENSASNVPSPTSWKSVIVLVPVRLGGVDLNKNYIPCIKNLLLHPLCIGIIGGKPKHSLYFVGWQEDKLIYLDPHFCQKVVDVKHLEFDTESFHCLSPRKLAFSKMDPSCSIGFYCGSEHDVDTLLQQLTQLCTPPTDKGKVPYPLIVAHGGRASDCVPTVDDGPQRVVQIRHMDRNGRLLPRKHDKDDFVYL